MNSYILQTVVLGVHKIFYIDFFKAFSSYSYSVSQIYLMQISNINKYMNDLFIVEEPPSSTRVKSNNVEMNHF